MTTKETVKAAAGTTQRPDSDPLNIAENTTQVDTSKKETVNSPNTNKASDANQGNEGTEDANAPGVNAKSTPGMDSDASSSMSLGTTTGSPKDNESVANAAARTNAVDDSGATAAQATLNNSPDANHSFRTVAEGNPHLNDVEDAPNAIGYTPTDEDKKSAKDKIKAMKATITEGTPREHVIFGIGGEKFTVGDLLAL